VLVLLTSLFLKSWLLPCAVVVVALWSYSMFTLSGSHRNGVCIPELCFHHQKTFAELVFEIT